MPVDEIATPYFARPEGSVSKLNTWRDGFRILFNIINLYRAERPLQFYGGVGLATAFASVGMAVPVVITYLQTGLVPRLPTAVLLPVSCCWHSFFAAIGLIFFHRNARPPREKTACLSFVPCSGHDGLRAAHSQEIWKSKT